MGETPAVARRVRGARPGPAEAPGMSQDSGAAGQTSARDWSGLEDAVRGFERAWRGGLRPRIEDHLPTDPGPRWAVLVELVHAELEFRLKAGEAARVEDYLARFP